MKICHLQRIAERKVIGKYYRNIKNSSRGIKTEK